MAAAEQRGADVGVRRVRAGDRGRGAPGAEAGEEDWGRGEGWGGDVDGGDWRRRRGRAVPA